MVAEVLGLMTKWSSKYTTKIRAAFSGLGCGGKKNKMYGSEQKRLEGKEEPLEL
jgi:hypothetical protein